MQPDFVAFDTKQREEFLSQTGNFPPGERDAFHKLCQNWQPTIPYNRFSTLVNRGDGATTSDLHSLMTKLRKQGYGLLRTKVQEGQRTKDAIVLTGAYDSHFISELLDEYFNDLLESIVNPLPLLSVIDQEFNGFPRTELQEVPSASLAQEYSTEENPEAPLAIETLDNDRILVTRGKLRPFIMVSIMKLRYYLSNTTVLELVARLLDTSLIALKQKIAGKEPGFWLGITQKIIDKRKEIDALRNVSVDVNFYHSAWFLRRLLESQITEAEQKKKESEGRQLDLEAVAMAVKESPEGWMEQDQLSRTLEAVQEKYGDRFDEFREEFYERYVHSHDKNMLPRIVLLDKRYMHRDRIFTLFLAHFKEVESDLKLHFTAQMENQLRRGSADTTFVNLENFDDAIRQYLTAKSPVLVAFIDKPAILAEGMIHHAKQNKLVKDVSELKQRLALYFDPDTMKPLPLHEWFNLRLLDLFEVAFEKLPILKRIWIRISGKYESFRSRYVGASVLSRELPSSARTPGATGQRDAPAAARNDTTTKTKSRADSGRRKTAPSTTSRPSRSSAALSAAEERKKRGYSKKQVDSAWEEFGSSIKKKD